MKESQVFTHCKKTTSTKIRRDHNRRNKVNIQIEILYFLQTHQLNWHTSMWTSSNYIYDWNCWKKNPLKRTPLNYQKFILVILLKHAIEYPTPLVYALSGRSTAHVFSAKKPLCLSFINGLAFNPTVPTSQHHLSKEICTQRQQRYITLHEMAQHRCINPTHWHTWTMCRLFNDKRSSESKRTYGARSVNRREKPLTVCHLLR